MTLRIQATGVWLHIVKRNSHQSTRESNEKRIKHMELFLLFLEVTRIKNWENELKFQTEA